MAKEKVFLDSSVIIASLLSTTGGSFYIINSLKDNFELQTNEYGLSEIQKVLKSKFADQPNLQGQLFLILGAARIIILPSPSKTEEYRAARFISAIDAPILASAFKHSDYLITLDNEFFKADVINFAQKKFLSILKPKEFIELFRR
jgi:predicted nucleic acid-binding protein